MDGGEAPPRRVADAARELDGRRVARLHAVVERGEAAGVLEDTLDGARAEVGAGVADDLHRVPRVGGLGEDRLKQRRDALVCRHGMGNERLQVIRHGETAKVTRHQHRELFPSEHEHEPDDQRPLEPGANQREHRSVRRYPGRE